MSSLLITSPLLPLCSQSHTDVLENETQRVQKGFFKYHPAVISDLENSCQNCKEDPHIPLHTSSIHVSSGVPNGFYRSTLGSTCYIELPYLISSSVWSTLSFFLPWNYDHDIFEDCMSYFVDHPFDFHSCFLTVTLRLVFFFFVCLFF